MRHRRACAIAVLLAACSGGGTDDARSSRDAPTEVDAASLVQAYAADADEADVRFAGRSLVVAGTVAGIGSAGRRLLLTSGGGGERLAASVVSSPHPVGPGDRVTLRCERLARNGNRPSVSRCAFLAIIPARIAGD